MNVYVIIMSGIYYLLTCWCLALGLMMVVLARLMVD